MKWEDLPIEIQEKMLERQVEQGNPRDPEVFKDCISYGQSNKGFTWEATPEGHRFWEDILLRGDISTFYTKYPKSKLVFEGGKVAYHCETEEVAKLLLDEAHKQGYKWHNGKSLINDYTEYSSTYNYYCINKGSKTSLSICRDNNYKIINAKDFLNFKTNQNEKNGKIEADSGSTRGRTVKFPIATGCITARLRSPGNTTKFGKSKTKVESAKISYSTVKY